MRIGSRRLPEMTSRDRGFPLADRCRMSKKDARRLKTEGTFTRVLRQTLLC
jgi:hypothetical protein